MISPNAPPPSAAALGGGTKVQALRPGCNLPPVGETRFVPTEVIVEASVLSVQTLNTIAASLNMTPDGGHHRRLTGRKLHRWRIDGGGSVQDMIRNICNSNRFWRAAELPLCPAQAEREQANSDQYAPQKLKIARGASSFDGRPRPCRGNRFRGRRVASRSRGCDHR